nr:MAG TPA_asm: hypothetical protein [Caudoviricetes sp.]
MDEHMRDGRQPTPYLHVGVVGGGAKSMTL